MTSRWYSRRAALGALAGWRASRRADVVAAQDAYHAALLDANQEEYARCDAETPGEPPDAL